MKAMTQMENAVMNMTGCDRQTANLVANAILDTDRETEQELYKCQYCGKYITNDEGITCVDGSWVCDNDSCRTDDEDGDSHIRTA
ncbi:MAG: hypothetical protein RSF40_01635 [Oscillospiraceae bacterium]